MLFHIKQVHAPENCPYGEAGPPSLRDESVPEVDLKAAYGAFMEHMVYMVRDRRPREAQQVPASWHESLHHHDHSGERRAASALERLTRRPDAP